MKQGEQTLKAVVVHQGSVMIGLPKACQDTIITAMTQKEQALLIKIIEICVQYKEKVLSY